MYGIGQAHAYNNYCLLSIEFIIVVAKELKKPLVNKDKLFKS